MISDDWLPTPEAINALPEPVRKYIASVETLCDPAGIVAENTLLRDQTLQLDAKIAIMRRRLNCPLHHEKRCVCGWVRGQN